MQKIILGNWKENGDARLVSNMIAALNTVELKKSLVGIFPPFVYLSEAKKISESSGLQIGAQNVSAFEKGAYTGEVSASMLKEIGCQMVLVGHSERRQLFAETDEVITKKFQQVLQAGLMPVLCIGETLAEYEAGQTEAIVKRQLEAVIESVAWIERSENPGNNLILAYEPVWAIGTGKAATKEQAQTVHAFIRNLLPPELKSTPILYGGSVKPDNAAELMYMPDIDGVLVGGACLVPEQFLKILTVS